MQWIVTVILIKPFAIIGLLLLLLVFTVNSRAIHLCFIKHKLGWQNGCAYDVPLHQLTLFFIETKKKYQRIMYVRLSFMAKKTWFHIFLRAHREEMQRIYFVLEEVKEWGRGWVVFNYNRLYTLYTINTNPAYI